MGGGNKGKGKKGSKSRKGGGAPAEVNPALLVLHNLAKEGKLAEMEAHEMTEMNLQYVDGLNRVPIHLAAYFGHVEIVNRIIEICPQSANKEAQDHFLPAHFAAQQGNLECLRSLVKYAGTTATGEENFGGVKKLMGRVVKGQKNLLHLAAAKQHVEIVYYLLDKGCDVYAKNAAGATAFELLNEENQIQVRAKLDASSSTNILVSQDDDSKKNMNMNSSSTISGGGGIDEPSLLGTNKDKTQLLSGAVDEQYQESADVDGGDEADEAEMDASEMEQKLAMMLGGEKKKKKKKRDREENVKINSKKDDAGDDVGEQELMHQEVEDAVPPTKKSKFSLDGVLKDSYDE